MTKKAVIYCRVACKDDIYVDSLNMQEKLCCDYAKSKGYKIIRCVKETGSGMEINPGLTKLVETVRNGRIGYVISQYPDRISRRFENYYSLKEIFKKYRAQFKFVSGDFSDEIASMARFYAKKLHKIKRAKK